MPAAVTTTSAAAIRAGRSVTGGTTRSRPGPQPEASAASRSAVPGTDTTVTSRGTSTRPSASATSGAQPPGSVPPITTSTLSGPTPADLAGVLHLPAHGGETASPQVPASGCRGVVALGTDGRVDQDVGRPGPEPPVDHVGQQRPVGPCGFHEVRQDLVAEVVVVDVDHVVAGGHLAEPDSVPRGAEQPQARRRPGERRQQRPLDPAQQVDRVPPAECDLGQGQRPDDVAHPDPWCPVTAQEDPHQPSARVFCRTEALMATRSGRDLRKATSSAREGSEVPRSATTARSIRRSSGVSRVTRMSLAGGAKHRPMTEKVVGRRVDARGDVHPVVPGGHGADASQRLRGDELDVQAVRQGAHEHGGHVVEPFDPPPRPDERIDQVGVDERAVGRHAHHGIGRVLVEREEEAGQHVVLAATHHRDPQTTGSLLDGVVAWVGGGRDHDLVDLAGGAAPAQDPLQDRHAAEILEHLAGQPGGAHPGLHDDEDARSGSIHGSAIMAPMPDRSSILRDSSILITGGTGSFGKAFLAELLRNHDPGASSSSPATSSSSTR